MEGKANDTLSQTGDHIAYGNILLYFPNNFEFLKIIFYYLYSEVNSSITIEELALKLVPPCLQQLIYVMTIDLSKMENIKNIFKKIQNLQGLEDEEEISKLLEGICKSIKATFNSKYWGKYKNSLNFDPNEKLDIVSVLKKTNQKLKLKVSGAHTRESKLMSDLNANYKSIVDTQVVDVGLKDTDLCKFAGWCINHSEQEINKEFKDFLNREFGTFLKKKTGPKEKTDKKLKNDLKAKAELVLKNNKLDFFPEDVSETEVKDVADYIIKSETDGKKFEQGRKKFINKKRYLVKKYKNEKDAIYKIKVKSCDKILKKFAMKDNKKFVAPTGEEDNVKFSDSSTGYIESADETENKKSSENFFKELGDKVKDIK